MAKRNQYNRPDLDHITELTLNKLQVSGSIRASGSLFVQSGTDPEISLKKSNPGARMRYRILEETIDFSAGTNRGFSVNTGITAAALNGEVKYTGSVKIPVNSQQRQMTQALDTSELLGLLPDQALCISHQWAE